MNVTKLRASFTRITTGRPTRMRSRRGRRALQRAAIVMAASICLVLLLAGSALAQTTTRASVSSALAQGNSNSLHSSISADGRYVAFASNASNLVTGDTNGVTDVFVYDTQAGTTSRVSVSSLGVQGNGVSDYPSISADGRYVAFESNASNLVTGDTNGTIDVFVYDRQTSTTSRVNVSSSGVEAIGDSYYPSISADGRYVAFVSWSTNLVAGDTNSAADVFVRDRQTGATSRVSVSSSGVQGNDGSWFPSISADGRYVAFESDASNLITGDTNAVGDTFVRDLQTGATSRVSVSTSGVQGNVASDRPSISADGRYVAFISGASNLVTGDTNIAYDTFVRDRQTGTTTRVSVSSSGVQADSSSRFPSISADGRYVAFQCYGTNLVTGDTNGVGDIFVRDRQANTTTRVSVSSSGVQGNGGSDVPSINADGRFVTFQSDGSNLVTGDTNGATDVFVATFASTPAITTVSPAFALTTGATSVTITGKNLTGATMVKFGGVAGTNLHVNSGTSLTVTCPAHAAGKVDVTVTSPGGTSTTVGAVNDFSYLARIEQTNTYLGYNGTWAAYPNTYFSGGTHAYTKIAGSSVTAAFTGSRLDWIGLAGPQYGLANVSVDGGTPHAVDLYNATNQFKKTLFSTGDLVSGLHTVTITCTGAKNASATDSYLSVDAFDTDGALTAVLTVQQSDSRLAYDGSWSTYANAVFSGGSYCYTQTAGSAVTIPFNGGQLEWIATKGPIYGIAQVSVDGASPTTVDLWAASYKYRQEVFSTGVLVNGLHTVRITYTGTKNTSASGTYVDADAFLIVGSAASTTRFDQTNAKFVWTSTWTLGPSSYCYGSSLRYVNLSGASVRINFTGVSLSYIAATAPNMGKAYVSIDDGAAVLVDLYSAATLYQQKVWSTGALTPGNHHVTITWSGQKRTGATGTNIDIDAVDVIGTLN